MPRIIHNKRGLGAQQLHRDDRSEMVHSGPLRDIRALEFSMIYAAPFAGIQLTDMGAEVIKVEPIEGEQMRHMGGGGVPGHGKGYQWMNRGKRDIALNLREQRGREIIHRLVPEVDVVLVNFRPGVPERLGIDYETLSAINPRLVYAEIIGFGRSGPLAGRAASDIVAQAYGGAIAVDGKVDDDGAPVWVSIPVGDLPAGMSAVAGICAALYHREQTGEGQRITVSLLRTVMALNGMHVMREPLADLQTVIPRMEEIDRVREAGGSYDAIIKARMGGPPSLGLTLYFTGYRAKDGGIVLGALTRANRDAIRKVVGIEGDPYDEPGFEPGDPKNREIAAALQAQIRRKLLEKTVDEWIELFEAAGAPVSPVKLPEELADDPQGSLQMVEVVDELTGPQRVVGPLFDMSKTPTAVAGPAPVLGADTDAILAGAGYSEQEIARLRADHIVA